MTDTWEPKATATEEGLSTLVLARNMSAITIHLSTSTAGLDTASPGYQAPLPPDQLVPVTEEDLDDMEAGEALTSAGGGRGGRGRGYRGNRWVGDGARGPCSGCARGRAALAARHFTRVVGGRHGFAGVAVAVAAGAARAARMTRARRMRAGATRRRPMEATGTRAGRAVAREGAAAAVAGAWAAGTALPFTRRGGGAGSSLGCCHPHCALVRRAALVAGAAGGAVGDVAAAAGSKAARAARGRHLPLGTAPRRRRRAACSVSTLCGVGDFPRSLC